MSRGQPVADYADVFTLEEWQEAVGDGLFVPDDGTGCWLDEDRRYLTDYIFGDDVWTKPPEGAVWVAWFNK